MIYDIIIHIYIYIYIYICVCVRNIPSYRIQTGIWPGMSVGSRG